MSKWATRHFVSDRPRRCPHDAGARPRNLSALWWVKPAVWWVSLYRPRRISFFSSSQFRPGAGLGDEMIGLVARDKYMEASMPTIALVDDDRNILTSVSLALEAEGFRVMTYTDGASAVDGFKSSPPDLAVLDMKMPRMDGMETLRRLRQTSELPVIFLTSKDEEIDELFGLKMGA